MISAYMMSAASLWRAMLISRPRPGEPITSSAVTARISATAAQIRTPVAMYGTALGSVTRSIRCGRENPNERAVSVATGSTSCTP